MKSLFGLPNWKIIFILNDLLITIVIFNVLIHIRVETIFKENKLAVNVISCMMHIRISTYFLLYPFKKLLLRHIYYGTYCQSNDSTQVTWTKPHLKAS